MQLQQMKKSNIVTKGHIAGGKEHSPNCPLTWGSERPHNMLFLGPTQVHSPNGA